MTHFQDNKNNMIKLDILSNIFQNNSLLRVHFILYTRHILYKIAITVTLQRMINIINSLRLKYDIMCLENIKDSLIDGKLFSCFYLKEM